MHNTSEPRVTAAEGDEAASLPPHSMTAEQVVQVTGSDGRIGLTGPRVRELRERFGLNELPEAPPEPAVRKLLRQFNEPVIWLLLTAALVSLAVGERTDAAVILAIVVINGVLGFVQEERAGRALAALRKLSAPTARVLRDGRVRVIPARELVPGDRISLEAGDNIPADVRLIASVDFRVLESALTGESQAVGKDADAVLPAQTPLAERAGMAFFGTTAVAGTAEAVVTATGPSTELGHIAVMLARQSPQPTPLQRRLAGLSRVLLVVCVLLVVIIFILHRLRGGALADVFLTSVSLAVAAVPEGLPAVVTIALALGLQRMARRNALVRTLPSVETLASVTVICSDKTGTLTRNEMTVRALRTADGEYQVTGLGYEPRGEFIDAATNAPAVVETGTALGRLLEIGRFCNRASLSVTSSGGVQAVGDPTEIALLVAASKGGIAASSNVPVVREIPFSSERKRMSVVVAKARGTAEMWTKGAPEVLLARCDRELIGGRPVPLTQTRRGQILADNAAMSRRALRVLAFAYRELPAAQVPVARERDLIFVGLAGLMDPPREEAKQAIEQCRQAGVRVVMITGDHPETARAVAGELALPADRCLTGPELDRLSDEELSASATGTSLYARVAAEHKLRIVAALQARDEIVAMTGDGVNDAPAVKAADIGVAMGLSGTDATKEAADMVLTDDNFASIVAAVEEGRGIFDNIRKFVHYLLACNAAEVLFMLAAAVAGWPLPLVAIQLLWINLVTDGLPALALGVEPAEPDVMRRPPRPASEPILTRRQGITITLHALLIAAATAAAFATGGWSTDPALERARTRAFGALAYAQLLYAFANRSPRYVLPELGALSNPKLAGAIALSALAQTVVLVVPSLRHVFRTAPLSVVDWLLVAFLSFGPVTVVELGKLLRRRPPRLS